MAKNTYILFLLFVASFLYSNSLLACTKEHKKTTVQLVKKIAGENQLGHTCDKHCTHPNCECNTNMPTYFSIQEKLVLSNQIAYKLEKKFPAKDQAIRIEVCSAVWHPPKMA